MELSEDRLKNMTDNMLRILNLTGIIDTEGKTKLSRENIQKVIPILLKLKMEKVSIQQS